MRRIGGKQGGKEIKGILSSGEMRECIRILQTTPQNGLHSLVGCSDGLFSGIVKRI